MHRIRHCLLVLAVPFLLNCGSSSNTPLFAEKKVCLGTEQQNTRLFLQQLSHNGVVIKWRGDADAVCVGKTIGALSMEYEAVTTAGGHKEAVVTGLQPDTEYFYSVGAAKVSPADAKQRFVTAPEVGDSNSDAMLRLWMVGDSGTATEDGHEGEAKEVYDGFKQYLANNNIDTVDLFLMLGDNAYVNGTDAQYQGAVFDLYTDLLAQTPLWPTIGNHEMGAGKAFGIPIRGTSVQSDPATYDDNDDATEESGMPYLDIFSLPTKGEMGGVASGTEQYYSFDHGNLHIVSLDSQLSARDDTQRVAMREWLISDLDANRLDWTIVIFHHPPYTKGKNHDSDDADTRFGGLLDLPQYHMRKEFTPIFDEYGVDVVYSGHAHSYERSYYLHGHTDISDTFTPIQHAEVDAGGNATNGQAAQEYAQVSTSSGVDDKVVYTVAGSSGKADAFPSDQHEAHYIGLAVKGSVLIEASPAKLTARFIDVSGDVLDHFSINR